jgi:hypothetical protein
MVPVTMKSSCGESEHVAITARHTIRCIPARYWQDGWEEGAGDVPVVAPRRAGTKEAEPDFGALQEGGSPM